MSREYIIERTKELEAKLLEKIKEKRILQLIAHHRVCGSYGYELTFDPVTNEWIFRDFGHNRCADVGMAERWDKTRKAKSLVELVEKARRPSVMYDIILSLYTYG